MAILGGVPTVSAGVAGMGRTLVGSLLLYVLISAPAYPAPPAVVVAKKPSLACPQTELGNPDLQARYATMWEDYSSDVGEATKSLQTEIDIQAKSATREGNLDLALFWKGLAKEFEQKGELRWDESSLKKGWGERFGDASFPKSFSVAVGKASEAYASATENLEKHYGELVTEITKTEQLELAVKIRGELKALIGNRDPSEERVSRSKSLGEYRSNCPQLARAGGGGADTEQCVDKALKWLVLHQAEDGGWSFDVASCPGCGGQCNAGCAPSSRVDRAGATGLALLPLLARGYTDKQGPYKKQIGKAISFLARLSSRDQGNLIKDGGLMSSQAYATLALSDYSELTSDKRLNSPIQLALTFMVQPNKDGSCWPAKAGDPPDTLTTACVLATLKRLPTHSKWYWNDGVCLKRAVAFLDSVQGDSGATYGLFVRDDCPPASSCTSAGLASRLALGWKNENPALQRGMSNLAKQGPTDDMLHNYFVSGFLNRMQGEPWIAWNRRMKERLLKTQAMGGHAEGSWLDGFGQSKDAQQMGRLYVTALASLILEVYYRYPPPSEESSR